MTSPLIIELARKFSDIIKRLREEGYVAVKRSKLNELVGGDIGQIPRILWPYGIEDKGDYILLYPSFSRVLEELCRRKILRLLQ
ncbi:hypothetical protein [Pyrobaculum sp.]|uniref:hypothetical protein n=1 Tax=Pyrobaculum sp. TaxID=2004705 RepID=UPI003D0B616B